jgi:solute:Na+ symporter, SSS family
MNAALAILAGSLALALTLGLLARRGRPMTLEQWTVGGRGFGPLFVFLLMAGEIYTTFTFLGGSGWAYGKGAPAFYILCYGSIAYALSYFLLPAIWRHGTRHGLHSQADYYVARYDSRALGVLVSLVGVIAMVPYLVLQLKGLGIIVSECSYGTISVPWAVWMSVTALVIYVIVSGVHGSAWTAVVKDILILAVVVTLGVVLPWRVSGGLRPMFETIARDHPGFLTLAPRGMSLPWFVSTVALSALGFYMWPHSFASTYTARSEDVFRKNAAAMPLYQLVLLFVFFTGFAALVRIPGLQGSDADLSLLRISRHEFAPWIVGVIGAAGVLTALVPGSMLLMTASTILVKNVVGALRPATTERSIARLARTLVPVVGLLAAVLTLRGGTTLVPLLLLGYSFVTQLFPSVVLSLGERRVVSAAGAGAGIVTGVTAVAAVQMSGTTLAKLLPGWPAGVTDLNIGVVALALNTLVMLLVSAVTPRTGRTTTSR